MSIPNSKPQTRITPVIPPDAPFLVRFWYKYFVFQAVYWRFAMFVLLVISAILLWPYAAIITGGSVAVPVQTREASQIFPGHEVSLIVIANEYAVPGSQVKLDVYLIDKTDNGESTKVVFKAIPASTNISLSIGEVVLQEGDENIWQATSIFSPTIPQDFDQRDFNLKIQAQITPEEANEPMILELTDIAIPVVRWPSFIVQLSLFLGSLGFFTIDQFGSLIKGLVTQGVNKA